LLAKKTGQANNRSVAALVPPPLPKPRMNGVEQVAVTRALVNSKSAPPPGRDAKPPIPPPVPLPIGINSRANHVGGLMTTPAAAPPPLSAVRGEIAGVDSPFQPNNFSVGANGFACASPESPPPHQPNDVVDSGPSPRVSDLRTVKLWKSWRSDKVKLPHYLVKGRGRQLEAILERFVAAIFRERLPGVEAAFAGELTNVAGINRPLRVLHKVSVGHMGVTDLVFRAEGNDLYVKFQSNPRTWITYLRVGMYVAGFLLIYAFLMALYLYGTGAYEGWATDYAQKHSRSLYADNDASAFLQKVIADGSYVFDNVRFVNEMSTAKATSLWKSFLSSFQANPMEFVGGHQSNDSSDSEQLDRAFQQMNLQFLGMMLQSMQQESLAIMATEKLGERYSTSDYFYWTNPDKPLRLRIMGIPTADRLDAVSTIEYSKETDLKNLFILDFGEKHRELGELAQSAFQKSVTYRSPWNAFKLFFSDPKLALLSIGGPSAIMAMLIGGGLYFLPLSVLAIPCRFLGWPTPDEFNNMVQARNAWVELVLSSTLLNEFGVQEGDRFAIMSQ
jgi:hypothetical protein